MNQTARLFVVGGMVVAGVVVGIAMSAALTGSSEEDPCQGAGRVEREFTTTDEEAEKFTVCKDVGLEVYFNESGTAVVELSRPEELIEYYKTHPAENPALIAEQTADAEFAEEGFVEVRVPSPAILDDGCPHATQRTDFEEFGVTICLPADWSVEPENEEILTVTQQGVASLSIYSLATRGTYGTKCARPQIIRLGEQDLKICARPLDPWGMQGHGLIFPDGREGGLTIVRPDDVTAADLAFQVAYSVRSIE